MCDDPSLGAIFLDMLRAKRDTAPDRRHLDRALAADPWDISHKVRHASPNEAEHPARPLRINYTTTDLMNPQLVRELVFLNSCLKIKRQNL